MRNDDLLQRAQDVLDASKAAGRPRRRSSTDEPKVPCVCGSWSSRVLDGRPVEDGFQRKRKCKGCGRVYYATERFDRVA
jgi:hypothetical protein